MPNEWMNEPKIQQHISERRQSTGMIAAQIHLIKNFFGIIFELIILVDAAPSLLSHAIDTRAAIAE